MLRGIVLVSVALLVVASATQVNYCGTGKYERYNSLASVTRRLVSQFRDNLIKSFENHVLAGFSIVPCDSFAVVCMVTAKVIDKLFLFSNETSFYHVQCFIFVSFSVIV